MADEILEDKYERFFRNTDIDLQAEIAAGGSEGGLTNYYTKTETNAITDALDGRITILEDNPGSGEVDLSNYYTKTQVDSSLSSKQAANANLTTIAGLAPTNGDILQRSAGSWASVAPATFKSSLSLNKNDVGLSNVNNTADLSKPISTATQSALDGLDNRVTTLEGSTGPDLTDYYTKSQVDTFMTGKQNSDSDLSTIAGLTPVDNDIIQRKAGGWLNRTPAQFKADLSLTATDVGLGNVNNTSDAAKNSAVATLTNKDLTSGTNTFPTFNQSTTGNAATATKLLTARTINGVSFDGTANITVADSTKVPTTRTVAGKALSADITLAKGDVGLGNVDNTSDASKPISSATQTALDAKAPLADTPRYLLFNTTWPARPADSRMTFFIGGDAATNAPADAATGDVWIPNT